MPHNGFEMEGELDSGKNFAKGLERALVVELEKVGVVVCLDCMTGHVTRHINTFTKGISFEQQSPQTSLLQSMQAVRPRGGRVRAPHPALPPPNCTDYRFS
jgi:hypothetical protein